MPAYAYERLSRQDNDFLAWEGPNLPMHVGGTQIFQAGPLRNEHGGVDFDAIKRLTDSVLHRIPRYRQKLKWIPGEEQAVWIDDEHFSLDYHFRHTSLPRPGTDEQLKLLTARLMEQPLDRSRPLWETWVIEGLAGDRFATVNKIHHCMIDGASGVDLSQLLLSASPEKEIRPAPRFIPRSEPRARELRADEWRRRALAPFQAASALVRFARDTEAPGDELLRRAKALASLVGWKAIPASSTPINGSIGPHRIIEWTEMSLGDMKAVRRELDCTINDLVLTIVTGAIRSLMSSRQLVPGKLDFRVSSPVNVRKESDKGELGNRVSSWLVRLPLGEEDPLVQLERIRSTTQRRKSRGQAEAVELATSMLDWLPISVQHMSVGTMNTIVTNVPGPQFPLYMLGAEMLQMVPFAPLIENIGLVIGVFSYNGKVSWGFNADYDRLPDLTAFRESIERAFRRLMSAAGLAPAAFPQVAELASGLQAASMPIVLGGAVETEEEDVRAVARSLAAS